MGRRGKLCPYGIFLVNLPIGLVGLWLTWRYATETSRAVGRELDVPGQAAVIAALACLAGSVIEGGPLGWSNPWVLSGFALFIILAVLFVFQERRVRQPMLPLALFRHGLFALTSTVGLLVNMAFYGLIFVLSLYFQQVNGLTPFATGLAFLPMMGAVLPMNLLAARASERFGARAVIALGATVSAAGCIALLGIARGTSYWAICAPVMAIGAGLGFLVPPLTATLLGSVEKARSGIAAGVLNATRQTGSVIGVAWFGSLVVKANAFIPGVRESLIISATLLLVAATAMMVGDRRK
jgi:DHA2 family methylenomycin A resistance protein-like MFS transporter